MEELWDDFNCELERRRSLGKRSLREDLSLLGYPLALLVLLPSFISRTLRLRVNRDRLRFTDANPRLTFDNFVVGAPNKLARDAALELTRRRSEASECLYIVGPEGMGKTHLLHAVLNDAISRNDMRVAYVSAEWFLNAVARRRTELARRWFARKFLKLDLLLLDDLDILDGRRLALVVLWRILEALHRKGRTVVICAERRPREFRALDGRLRSFLESGALVELQTADFDLREAILGHKAKAFVEAVQMAPDVAAFIARETKSSVRDLEGNLVRLVACSSLTGRKIDLELAETMLSGVVKKERRRRRKTIRRLGNSLEVHSNR